MIHTQCTTIPHLNHLLAFLMSHKKLVSLEAWMKTNILLGLMSYQRKQGAGFIFIFFGSAISKSSLRFTFVLVCYTMMKGKPELLLYTLRNVH